MTLPSANFGHRNLPCPTENNVFNCFETQPLLPGCIYKSMMRNQVLAEYLNMALASKRFLFLLIAVLVASTPAEAKKAKVTHIEFYMHDIVGGPNPTAVRVAGRASNFSSSDPIASMFGSIFVMDNPLTATPDLNSTLMGRAQGIYAMSSQHDEFSLLMTLTYNFISGAYNGSSFSVVGQNPVMREVRETPIVGGMGMFRLARGYCLAKTFSTNQMDAVIGYNATVIHY